MRLNIRAVSPLIATVLLVAISLSIAGLLFNWMSQFTTEQTTAAAELATTNIVSCGRAGIRIKSCDVNSSGTGATSVIESTGSIDLNGFNVVVLHADGNVQNITSLFESTTLFAGSFVSLNHPLDSNADVSSITQYKVIPVTCPSSSASVTVCS